MAITGGPSPGVRSTQACGESRDDSMRYISGRAECTPSTWTAAHTAAAHLRACGAHRRPRQRPADQGGTSPGVRSAPTTTTAACRPGRHISGRAERTVLPGIGLQGGPAHLRACGAHDFMSGRIMSMIGTSPGVRSAHGHRTGVHVGHRHISGRAERTSAGRAGAGRNAAHLRACGVHSYDSLAPTLEGGTSPGVRSAHRQEARGLPRLRHISGRAECTPGSR